MESGLAVVQILRRVSCERSGSEKMTLETMPEGLRAWLHRKGFVNDEDVAKLEKAGGSLAEALLIFLHLLPWQSGKVRVNLPFSEPGHTGQESGRDRNR